MLRLPRIAGRLAAAAVLAGAASLVAPASAVAQAAIDLPVASPKARIEQRVGLTDFTVEYSRPAVKGREIFGGLVPWNEVWRTGANAATLLTASRDFQLGDKMVPAGTYSLFTIPGQQSWTVILNSDTRLWGSYEYDSTKDVARIEVTPEQLADRRERLTLSFIDFTDDTASLDIEWDRVRVRVPLKVDSKSHATANIDAALARAWRPHYEAARWLLENDGDVQVALAHVEKSLAIQPDWSAQWVKAQLLHKAGKKGAAIKAAREAQKLGKGNRIYEGFYAEPIAATLASWNK